MICKQILSTLCALFVMSVATSAQDKPGTPVGINLAGPVDWNQEHPLVDVFRLSRSWISQREGAKWGSGPELDLDEHGWVRSLKSGCYAETPIVTHGAHPAGIYTLLYDGKGLLKFNGDVQISERNPGRILIETEGKSAIFVQLRETDPADPLRNIRVIMPGHEESYIEQPWNPDFLKRWKGMATLRFMDFMHTNNSKLEHWEDRPQMNDATWTRSGGIPIEMLCDLANRLDADPWFCIPHLANDEFVREFAKLAKSKLEPERIVWIEYSNEIWNGMFSQAQHVQKIGMEQGLDEKPWGAGWRYGAIRSLELFAIWQEVFGDRERLKRVLATQAANPFVSERICETRGAGGQADVLAVAPYISFNVQKEQAPDVANLGVEGILDQVEKEKLPKSFEWMRKQKEVADKWNLQLVCYEAGQHLVGVGGGENHQPLTDTFMAANRHPRMADIYKTYLDGWQEISGGGLICMFSSCGNWGKWGSWGLLEDATKNQEQSPKFRATIQWAAQAGNPVSLPSVKNR